MNIYDRILFLMEKKEIKNFMELSKLSGIPYMTLKNIFNRKSDIKASVLNKLKLVLDTSLEYLITGKEIAIEKPHTLTDDEKYLLALFNELAESSQKLCISSIEGMVLAEKGELPKVKHYLQNLEKEL